MKRKMIFLFTLICAVVCSVLCFVSCKKEAEPVCIRVDEAVAQNTTLIDVMEDMREKGELTYTLSNGMVTEINGVRQGTNSYWMLYISDTENVDTSEWGGTYEYEGQTLGSAMLGAESLVVKQGEIYVWVYQTF